jgi:asparagine synthase (glutamine-hydrolysing)
MCGIAGAVDLSGAPIDRLEDRLRKMNELQKHRGPDGEAVWTSEDRSVGLAHVRLAIVDEENGGQPMRNGRFSLVMNGEIYNHDELRRRMGPRGFRSKSDAEVVLRDFMRGGDVCVEDLRGMFAFAVWDSEEQTLTLARDRFGIKPLYYAQVGNVIYFASEAKALLPFVDVEVDEEALAQYLTFQFFLGDRTLIKAIREIPPAKVFTFKPDGSLKTRRFWSLNWSPDFDHSEKFFEKECLERLIDSVRIHRMMGDAEVGALVSGGIDSSAVALLAEKWDGIRQAFHGFFWEEGFSERTHAREVASKGLFSLEEIEIQPRDFVENMGRIVWHLDFPMAGPGAFPQFMVAEAVKDAGLKVVLGGQGGDELFQGYARYAVSELWRWLEDSITGKDKRPAPIVKGLRAYTPMLQKPLLFGPEGARYFQLIDRSHSIRNACTFREQTDFDLHFRSCREETTTSVDAMAAFDIETSLRALLHVDDRTSMAHGVETRTPFLDHPFAELVASIPSSIRFGGELKRLPRRFLRDVLPSTVIDRHDKMGFPVPLSEWLKKTEVGDYVQGLFREPSKAGREYIDYGAALEMTKAEGTWSRGVWALLNLDLWFRRFVDDRPRF